MNIIEILASPHDFLELFQCASPFRTPVLIRRQVTRDDVWTNISSIFRWWIGGWYGTRWEPTWWAWGDSGKEVGASGQVSGGVRFCRPLVRKVRVPVVCVIEVWRPAGSVATIAVTL